MAARLFCPPEKFLSQPYLLKRIRGTPFYFLFIQSQIFRSETHIRKHVYLKKLMLWILKYQPHLAAQLFHIIILLIDILTVKINVPLCGFYQTVQMLHQSGLPRPRMSDYAYKLPVGNGQADIIQRP